MICLLEHFLRSTGQNQILEHCQHSFSRCSSLGPSATVWMPQTGSSPALPPPPTCLSHLAHLSERLSGWCNIYPRNPEVQAPNHSLLLPQPSAIRPMSPAALSSTLSVWPPTWVSLHLCFLTSCSRAGALLLCAYLEPRDLPFLNNNTTVKFKVVFILEVLNNVGKNNWENSIYLESHLPGEIIVS